MAENNRPPNATPSAIIACAEWLIECLRLGWRKRDLEQLEHLWWQYHDAEGEKKPPSYEAA